MYDVSRSVTRYAGYALWAHKRRTLLTMFGIAWGIISITLMVAAGEGLGRGIQKQQENFGKDVMIVFAGRTSMQAGGTRSGRVMHWMEDDYTEVAKEAPACKYVMPELGNNVKVHSAFNSGDIDTVGSLPPFTVIRSIAWPKADSTTTKTTSEGRRVAFLGSDTKKQLFAEREAIGQTIELNGIPYTVIGVMKTKDQNSSYDGVDIRKIFIPFNSMKRDFPNKPPAVEHTVDRLLVAPWSLETHPDCVRQIRRTLGRLHNFDPRDEEAASIWDTVKNAQANRMIFVGMEVFMGAVGHGDDFSWRPGRDERDARERARAHSRDRGAESARRDPRIDPAPVFPRDCHPSCDQRRGRADHLLRIMRTGEFAAEDAVLRRPGRQAGSSRR